MKHLGTQIYIGLFLSLGVLFAIMSRTVGPFFEMLAICAFFCLGDLGVQLLRKPRGSNLRSVGMVLSGAFILVIAVLLLFFVERLYMVNASSYPSWLATRDLGQLSEVQFRQFIFSPECPRGSEAFNKDGGQVVVRCGGMTRLTPTFVAHLVKESGQ